MLCPRVPYVAALLVDPLRVSGAYTGPAATSNVSQTGLFRVLESPRENDWLFVPVEVSEARDGSPAVSGTDSPEESRPGPQSPATDDTDGGRNDVTGPGVPDVGDGKTDVSDAAEIEPDPSHSYEPIAVSRTGHGDADETVASLRPGYLVRATLSWERPEPRVHELRVEKQTLFEFVDGVVDLFEAARSAWTAASATGEAMTARVTRGTDGRVNGVLYVFADADGGDRLEEFRSGQRPLEPLLARVNAAAPATDTPGSDATDEGNPSVSVGPGGVHVSTPNDGPTPDHGLGRDREVFVLRPADGPFVVVLVALRKGGTLANTVRETYHCPRPEE